MGEMCRDEDPRCPHEHLGCQEEEPEEGPRPAGPADGGDPEPAVHQAEDDHSRGLAVTRGDPGPGLTGQPGLDQRDVVALLRHPPVGPVTLQQPLANLNRSYVNISLGILTTNLVTMLIHSLMMKAPRNFIPFK